MCIFHQGVIHPVIARIIWTDHQNSLSPYRFCNKTYSDCNTLEGSKFYNKIYILDFAGGGAVHLLGILPRFQTLRQNRWIINSLLINHEGCITCSYYNWILYSLFYVTHLRVVYTYLLHMFQVKYNEITHPQI